MFTCVLGRYVASTVLSVPPKPFGGQLHGDKEWPFSVVTSSGSVWRKVSESNARSKLYIGSMGALTLAVLAENGCTREKVHRRCGIHKRPNCKPFGQTASPLAPYATCSTGACSSAITSYHDARKYDVGETATGIYS